MTFQKEADFEEALIKVLADKGWEKEVIKNPTEQDLIRNWANILYDNNRGIDRLNNYPLTDGEMQLVNPLEQQNAVKTLYSEFVSPVCAKYGLTRIELDILLFLANNTRYDTATDIVEVRFLAKSQVSAAIKNLEARGCLRREYQLENRKTAHLRLCDPAQPMIAAGRSAQEQFGAALLDGFTPEELEHMQRSMERIRKNVEKYLEDKNNDNVD